MDKVFMALVLAFLCSFCLTPLIKKLAFKVGAVDAPSCRKVHCRVMPRLGGLAIYCGFVVAVLIMMPLTKTVVGILISATMIMLLGVVDDIRDISPKVKLAGQVLAALVLVSFGVTVSGITNPFSGMLPSGMNMGVIPLGILSIPVTVFWIIGITNAVNLVDGLDGLAAGMAVIASITLAGVAWMEGQMLVVALALILACSILGFLRYNFHPAQIFMGDSGSMFLGFILATLAILGLGKGATVISVFIPILILGVPILDTAFAIVRRYLNNQPIFKADKEHLHHRLLAMGLSHKGTVLVIYGLNILLSISAVMLTVLTTAQAVMILTILSAAILIGAEKIGVIPTLVSLKGTDNAGQQKTFQHGGK